MKNYIVAEDVIPKMEEGKQVVMKLPEGSKIELTDIEQAEGYLNTYLRYCDFYFEED